MSFAEQNSLMTTTKPGEKRGPPMVDRERELRELLEKIISLADSEILIALHTILEAIKKVAEDRKAEDV